MPVPETCQALADFSAFSLYLYVLSFEDVFLRDAVMQRSIPADGSAVLCEASVQDAQGLLGSSSASPREGGFRSTCDAAEIAPIAEHVWATSASRRSIVILWRSEHIHQLTP